MMIKCKRYKPCKQALLPERSLEKTTIPIPRLHVYCLGKDNILGLPFMLLDFIDGKALINIDIPKLPDSDKRRLFAKPGDIYLQLFQQQFNYIGFNPSRLIAPNQVFHSAIDYIFMIHQALLDEFHLRRDSVCGESDARSYLYGLLNSRQFLMDWVKPEHNHGPFVLMHGDLRSANILVDDDLNIVSVLDWEWSHTIPLQMFVPPPWLSGCEVLGVLKEYNRLYYDILASVFESETRDVEYQYHLNSRNISKLPLSNLWKRKLGSWAIFIAHGLMQPLHFGNVYTDVIDPG
ncbi:hypothetical protein CIHG_10105 [Coccidioides immitis H538.4]|uniref:Aminoglycoside phosphotransferase domain-containing protein n=1 Tax=Coccidioides immitis H538.4 TaxID=396776 RepID=A0A0J8S497_COCIT|nr:hypothetical protein CIHG_10105 [Coccidioides immitis H538.4]